MKWAMESAPPMPAQLVAVLSGLAYHADKHGRGAYPSLARLAAYTCKAPRQVRRDLRQLEELKLIRPGDPEKAVHLPADKRPPVYDLAMERTVPGGRAGSDEGTRASARTLASARERGRQTREAKKARSHHESSVERGDVDVPPDVGVPRDVGVTSGRTPTSRAGGRGRPPNQKKNQELEEGGARSLTAARRSDEGLHPLPDDFALSDAMRRWAKRDGYSDVIDIDHCTAQFASHFRSTGARRRSWPDAWQKWIREDAKKAAEHGKGRHLRAVNSTPEDRGIF